MALKPFGGAENGKKGMTLIEIIIVVALLGTLMAILVTNLTSSQDSAKEGQARLGMGGIAQALQLYRVHNNLYPTSAQGLNALVSDPGSTPRWRGPYIEAEKLKDPWGQSYEYSSDGRKFEIVSGGVDLKIGGAHNIFYPERAPEAGGTPAPTEQPAP
jgi:general secretion pathway protein G